jgi:hypothetical protein
MMYAVLLSWNTVMEKQLERQDRETPQKLNISRKPSSNYCVYVCEMERNWKHSMQLKESWPF